MNFTWTGVLLAIALSFVGVAADTLLKVASAQPRPFWNGWFLLGVLCTAGFAVLWVLLMQTMKLAAAGVMYAVTSALMLVGVGVVVFGERLSGAESTGVVMALLAVLLLGRLAA